ncbi:DUF2169 family type VI secretion system accessory protein [Marinimicrobium locisalis]|uniref:DUF2169 family type VI secretion system accessory protein n=1 Tax=Marinimicrobium locisalis TaxID=546022 RepID=UPI003221DB68
MPLLDNKTPFAASYHIMPNAQGQDAVFLAAKATFNIGASWTLADEQVEPVNEDIYWGEPGKSSLRWPSDVHLPKPGTDIAILAHAWAPEKKPVRSLDVRAQVAGREQTLRVWGDRVWREGAVGAPEPFESVPIRYEFAYGGRAANADGVQVSSPANPVGRGFHPAPSAKALEGQPLPNIEYPDQLISRPEDKPRPAGFGFIPPYWEPRFGDWGTYDEHWQQNRAPYVPLDYQPRAQQAAHPDWVWDGYLQGGEPVYLEHMHPGGPLSFELPQVKLGGQAAFSGRPRQDLAFVLDTLVIDVDGMTLSLTWQASCVCNNDLHRLRSLTLGLKR